MHIMVSTSAQLLPANASLESSLCTDNFVCSCVCYVNLMVLNFAGSLRPNTRVALPELDNLVVPLDLHMNSFSRWAISRRHSMWFALDFFCV